MKRTLSFTELLFSKFLLGTMLLLSLSSLSYASDDAQDSLHEQFSQIRHNTHATLNNALAIKQAIARFAYKKNSPEPSSQLSIYVALSAAPERIPSEMSVDIKLNDTPLVHHNYNLTAINALLNGANHKLLINNLSPGKHHLLVKIREKHGLHYDSHDTLLQIDKTNQHNVLELSISLPGNDIPPEVAFLNRS